MRVIMELKDPSAFNEMLNRALNKSLENTKNLLRDSMMTIISTAKENCPVDTGRLRSSINGKIDDLVVECYARTEYAIYVELGTYKMAARPFMRTGLMSGLQYFMGNVYRILI